MPWPRSWVNLRSSRATELADIFPSKVAADWLGHTEAIADKHYRQTTREHFERVIKGESGALLVALHCGASQNVTEQNPSKQAVSKTSKTAEKPKKKRLHSELRNRQGGRYWTRTSDLHDGKYSNAFESIAVSVDFSVTFEN